MTVIDRTRTDSSTRASEADLRDCIVAALRRWPSAGVAVAVIRGGFPVQYFCHGVADVASGRPVGEGTVFRIGSLTKTVTAVAVMQLCEQGLVDLDAPANDYLRAVQLVPASAGFGPRRCGICSRTPLESASGGGTQTCFSTPVRAPASRPAPSFRFPSTTAVV